MKEKGTHNPKISMPKMRQPDRNSYKVAPLSEAPSSYGPKVDWSPQPKERNTTKAQGLVPSPTNGYGPRWKVERKETPPLIRPPSKSKKGPYS